MNHRVSARAEPEIRIGHCCGCNVHFAALYKIPGIYRYRCATCYEREMGYRHWLSLPKAPARAATNQVDDHVVRETAELGVVQ